MNQIEILKDEHEIIERELIELDEIIESEDINYPNLLHVLKNLIKIWDPHEKREESVFKILEKENIKIPVEQMFFGHKKLKKHKDAIIKAIEAGSDYKLKKALHEHGTVISKELREHINFEDEILYTIALEEFTPEELVQLCKDVA
ncbi:hypothetical protein GOV14_01505 [Candidatus Pacearchaeota archaeon]|nr:hypothetical protein [Candidatus Pacearchaeota archaeon]